MSEATVIALGFFDGVHLGHGALLRKTAERARELGVTPAAFTFDRSPKEFVTGVPVPLLTSAAERAEIIREYYGIGTVFVEPFDRAMMTMPWEDFITELLVKKYRAVHLVAGHDFRFGYKNEGDPEKLREKCRALGLGCDIIPKVELDGVTVSSTYIRSLIEAGEVERAARFLGHPHRMSGTVRHGEGIGKKRVGKAPRNKKKERIFSVLFCFIFSDAIYRFFRPTPSGKRATPPRGYFRRSGRVAPVWRETFSQAAGRRRNRAAAPVRRGRRQSPSGRSPPSRGLPR